MPVKILKLPKLLKERIFSRRTELPSTGALDHGGPLKGEDAERCSPNYKIQLGLNIDRRLPAMIRNHLTVPSWTSSVVVPASNHHHSHDIMTIIQVKSSHRALLDIFSGGPSLDPGIAKPPHQRRCRVPSDRGAAHLGKSAIWRLISITICGGILALASAGDFL